MTSERVQIHRFPRRGRHYLLAATVVIMCVALLASCSSSPAQSSSGKPITGGTVTFAEPPGVSPSWILPFVDIQDYSYFTDFDWDWEMWRPVYFVGTPTSPNVNSSESLAYPPVFTNNDQTVTVTLKPWRWSDGTPITARNVLFFFNLLKAEKLNWWLYVPGTFPDNVKSAEITGERTIVFQLTHSYNPEEFSQNELQSLTPLPLAWDRTSLAGSRGAGSVLPSGTGAGLDMTPAGAKAVYNFLISQNKDVAGYGTNWLWKIVDGPFQLSSYSVNGLTTMTPNPDYGGVKPKISKLVYLPFTTDIAEFAALESGSEHINVGYTTYDNVSQQSRLSGYSLQLWPIWAANTVYMNFNNPANGMIFQQQYIREAMQSLIDEPTIVKYIYKGLATLSEGMVPLNPATQWLTSYAKSYPFPYDPAKAVSLLQSHGWSVHPGGITTCTSPGSGPTQCGAGIASGARLSFPVIYSNAIPQYTTELVLEKTDFSKAGIALNLRPVSPSQVYQLTPPCTSSQTICSWQMVWWGDNTDYPYPFLQAYWGTGAVENYASYSSPQLDQLFTQAVESPIASGLSPAFTTSDDFVLSHLLSLFEPVIPYQLTEVSSNLQGVLPQSPELAITPELWYFTQ